MTTATHQTERSRYDFVVVGSGAAGLTAALVAALCGLTAAVFEKSALLGGTTSKSGGAVWIPCNHHMGEVGVADSRQDALGYLSACTGLPEDHPNLTTLVDHGAPMIELLERRAGLSFAPWPAVGPTFDYRPWLPGAKRGGRALLPTRTRLDGLGAWAKAIRVDPYSIWTGDPVDYYVRSSHLEAPGSRTETVEIEPDSYGRGTALVAQLVRGCLDHGVELFPNSPVDALVQEGNRVAGVWLGAGERTVLADAGVLLATGGYSHNRQLCRQWLSRPLVDSCEVDENQGDGHLMGVLAGAQMSGLGDAWWMPRSLQPSRDGSANIGGSKDDRCLPHAIMVDRHGRRFVNEAVNYYDAGASFGGKGAAPEHYPAWLVFDRQGVDKYAVLSSKLTGDAGAVLTAASIGELARLMGIDETELGHTIERFNHFASTGVDRDFGRGANAWDRGWGDPAHRPNPSLGTLAVPPFHAAAVYPGALATRGGLHVDGRGRVLSARETGLVDGLFAAGNCSSGGPTGAYPGPGATLGAAMTFGYTAAGAAANAFSTEKR